MRGQCRIATTDRQVATTELDTLVIGGGFYGCSLAAHLARTQGDSVMVLEAGKGAMLRASFANQARIHRGYHYPRSLMTGLRSSLNFPRFTRDYSDCLVDDFEMYYALARSGSNVTADQFARFCERIGVPLEPAPREIASLFDARRIDRVFRVEEIAFDAEKLRRRVLADLAATDVELRVTRTVRRLRPIDGGLEVTFEQDGCEERLTAARVFTCVYSRTNRVLADSGIAPIPLKHEIAEVALVELPEPFDQIGVTVMCGPFFSFMPFPPLGVHSFTHVRYTPHAEWQDGRDPEPPDPYMVLARMKPRSRFEHMLRDAVRYVPEIARARQVGSLWEVKTVLPRSALDDSRPILLQRDIGMPKHACIIGAKIDCIYDVIDELSALPVRQRA